MPWMKVLTNKGPKMVYAMQGQEAIDNLLDQLNEPNANKSSLMHMLDLVLENDQLVLINTKNGFNDEPTEI